MIDGVPVTLVGGYLGAGKTTLVNHLLRASHGLRIAVLVNDFGALPVDADLVVARAADVIHLAGGCICCSFGSDLVGALMDLARGDRSIDHVVVETSGVSLPASVASTITLIPRLSLRSTVVVADAPAVRAQVADALVGDTISRQLAQADLVVLNKIDRVPDADRAALGRFVAAATPRAHVIVSAFGVVPAERVLGTHPTDRPAVEVAYEHHADALYETVVFVPELPVDVDAIAAAIADPRCGVARAKGVIRGPTGGFHAVQIVGAQVEVAPYVGESTPHEGIVCIGVRGRIDHGRLAEALSAFRPRDSGSIVNPR